jgi:hypothetical protein
MRKMVSAPCRLCSPTLPRCSKRACLKERAVQEATWFNGRCGVSELAGSQSAHLPVWVSRWA